jgi:hypothetical protein
MIFGKPFLLKKLYDGNNIIAKNKDSKKGTMISEALLIPLNTIIILAITIK